MFPIHDVPTGWASYSTVDAPLSFVFMWKTSAICACQAPFSGLFEEKVLTLVARANIGSAVKHPPTVLTGARVITSLAASGMSLREGMIYARILCFRRPLD